MSLSKLTQIFISLSAISAQQIYDESEIRETIDEMTVTCSSAIRLQNLGSGYYLHGMGVQYGQGSG